MKGRSVRRTFAGLLAVLALGALSAAGPVLAQSTTDTTGGYTNTTTTSTSSVPTEPPTTTTNAVAPTSDVDATPPAAAPSQLAFTGANAVWIILLGVGLAAVATTLLVVDRRSRHSR